MFVLPREFEKNSVKRNFLITPEFIKLHMDLFTSSKLHSRGSHFYEAYFFIHRHLNAFAACGANGYFHKN